MAKRENISNHLKSHLFHYFEKTTDPKIVFKLNNLIDFRFSKVQYTILYDFFNSAYLFRLPFFLVASGAGEPLGIYTPCPVAFRCWKSLFLD